MDAKSQKRCYPVIIVETLAITSRLEMFKDSWGRDRTVCLNFESAEGSYLGLRYEAELPSLRIIVSAGAQRTEDLTTEAQQSLFDQGFRRKRMSENFEKTVDPDDLSMPEVTSIIEGVFAESFGEVLQTVDHIEFPLLDSDDSPVLSAMDLLSKQRDWNSRKTLYRMLLDTNFVFPVQTSGEPLVEGQIGSWPVCSTFTSHEALFRHHPLGVSCTTVIGSELFSQLVLKRFGSLRINPGSDIRGELYFNELEMLKDAAEKLAKHYSERK